MSEKEGELKNRIDIQTCYHCEGGMCCGTVSNDAMKQLIDEAKAEFLKIIKKPVENDYELGIPAEREQLDHDCELYELFVKWFGESK